MKVKYLIIGVVLAFIALGAAGALAWQNNKNNSDDQTAMTSENKDGEDQESTDTSSNDSNQEGDSQMGMMDTDDAAVTKNNCLSEDCLEIDDLEYPVDELPNSVIDALDKAIDDEYKANATYAAVIDQLGSIRPFSMIIRAEEQHIASLKSIYDKYGVNIPNNPYSSVSVASTKTANCTIGVQAEIDNAALYRDQLLPAVTGYSDITSVFTNLMNASQNKHLPAFQKCAN